MTSIINDEWFNQKIKQIQNRTDCAKLQEDLDDVERALAAQMESLERQLAQYTKWLQILSPPGSIDDVLTWVGKVISLLSDEVAPYAKAAETEIELANKYIAMLTALQQKISTLHCNITVGTPPTPTPRPSTPSTPSPSASPVSWSGTDFTSAIIDAIKTFKYFFGGQ